MVRIRIPMAFDPTTVMYLIIVDALVARHREALMAQPTDKFQSMLHNEVMAHVLDGKEPPEQIRTAVMNVADDMMAGRDITLRAGDYIALMDYAREQKML
jgi:hypothetical protein